jgi:hypothetical protein
LAFAAAVAWMATGYAQGQSGDHNPFWDRSDNGEVIHVLPTPASIHSPRDTEPTFASVSGGYSIHAASYGSGNLTNHGGPQISGARFQQIYWNTAASEARQGTGPTLSTAITGFVNSYSNNRAFDASATSDYTIIQQYANAAADPTFGDLTTAFIDNQQTQKTISDSNIRSYIASLLSANRFPTSESTVYGVYLPSGMKITAQGGTSCSAFCGYHGHFTYAGKDIKYAAFPYTDCRACSFQGLTATDILTLVTSHEIREAVTDPDLNSWYDAAGYEADDKCAWHNLYQTVAGFWVQPEYSNGNAPGFPGPGCYVAR